MNIRAFLERTNTSVTELERATGNSQGSIYSWLRGAAVPTYKVIVNLLKMGIRLDEIFDEEVCEAVLRTHSSDSCGVTSLSKDQCADIVKAGLAMLNAQGASLDMKVRVSDH